MGDESEGVIADLRDDSLLKEFFSDDFDEALFVRSLLRVDDGVSTSLDESTVEKTLFDVRQRTGQLVSAIKQVVSSHQDALLVQAGACSALKHQLLGVREHCTSAEENIRRLRMDVLQPCTQIRSDAVILRNATAALDLLRRTQRAHHSIRRLKVLAGSTERSSTAEPQQPPGPVAMDVHKMVRLAPILHEVSLVSSILSHIARDEIAISCNTDLCR